MKNVHIKHWWNWLQTYLLFSHFDSASTSLNLCLFKRTTEENRIAISSFLKLFARCNMIWPFLNAIENTIVCCWKIKAKFAIFYELLTLSHVILWNFWRFGLFWKQRMAKLVLFFGPGNRGREERGTAKKWGKVINMQCNPSATSILVQKNKCKGGFSIYLNFPNLENMLNSRFQYGQSYRVHHKKCFYQVWKYNRWVFKVFQVCLSANYWCCFIFENIFTRISTKKSLSLLYITFVTGC